MIFSSSLQVTCFWPGKAPFFLDFDVLLLVNEYKRIALQIQDTSEQTCRVWNTTLFGCLNLDFIWLWSLIRRSKFNSFQRKFGKEGFKCKLLPYHFLFVDQSFIRLNVQRKEKVVRIKCLCYDWNSSGTKPKWLYTL